VTDAHAPKAQAQAGEPFHRQEETVKATTDTSLDLRTRMVDAIVTARPTSPQIEDAMRSVARHQFVPKASLEHAYADEAVITHRAADGSALSCASVPSLVAVMLDNLHVQPGNRILEIGAGTGYNAALLAHLTGPTGYITTVDIDPEVTAEARSALDATGYSHVNVVTGDGQLGDPDHGLYDRIIVTVGAWDIPTAWWGQLTVGGRLVVPLRWRGQTRAIAFVREADRMRSDWVELCGFVPMIGQDGEHTGHIDPAGHVAVYWDTDQPINTSALLHVLNQPKATTRSGVTVGPDDPFDGVWLHLAATEPGTCRVAADPIAVEINLCRPAIPVRSPAVIQDGSIAYMTLTRLESVEPQWELGAAGHGPLGNILATRICDQIREWDCDRSAEPAVTANQPSPVTESPGTSLMINKPCTQLLVTY
jgi:protein-L-isoaspartate(D-aspartate) O-methyltransferase